MFSPQSMEAEEAAAAAAQKEKDKEAEDKLKEATANEVLRLHAILDRLLVQKHLQDVHVLELARRMMLPVRARGLDLEGYMQRLDQQ